MRNHFFLLLTIFFCLSTQAQQTTKFDLRFWNSLRNGEVQEKNMPLLVKGNLTGIKKLTESLGGKYKSGRGNIASVEIPVARLWDFEKSLTVERIENTSAKGTYLMDTARIRNNVDSVHQGFAPLNPTGLKGRGVVMGIIDGGIYWQHGDFRNPDSSTRIRYIWDQVVSGANAPVPYGYGNQWSWIDINNGNCTHVPPTADNGHGTCVAGIAAGNSFSTANSQYEGFMTGVAPETEILAVRIKDDVNFLANVADAIDYIFKKADAMGKPCVINTSIGTYYGSHDGGDLAAQMIDTLIAERSGRVVVAALGNAGEYNHHLSYNIPQDSAYTFFNFNNNSNQVYFDFWADTANFKNAFFAIGCNDALGTDLGRTAYLNVISDFNPPAGSAIVIDRTLTNGSTALGEIKIAVSLEEGKYHVEFLVLNVSDPALLWRLQTQGTGKFDLWASSAVIGTSDIITKLQGNLIQYTNYRHPDSLKTMVSSWQCSDKVITVGNYSSRAGYLDRDSNYQNLLIAPYNQVVGRKASTSSLGPTRDGRLKPDIMATGETTIATGDGNFINAAISPSNRIKVSITKKHIRNGGTSMAAPIVAGVAAMYLEKRPTARYDEIKKAIILTAKKDSFTTTTPNPAYGNGKVNAFRAVTYSGFVYGVMDTACINYNPQANIDTLGCIAKAYGIMDTACLNYDPLANVTGGACVIKIYGCTDPSALNFDSTANIENGSCQYPNVGIKGIEGDLISMSVIPNPFSGQTTFRLNNTGYEFAKGEIRILNQLGQTVDAFTVNNTVNNYNYSSEKLGKGVYYYLLLLDNKNAGKGKLVIQ